MGLSRGLSVVSAARAVCPRAGGRNGLGTRRLDGANSDNAAMVTPNFRFFIAGSRCILEFVLQRATRPLSHSSVPPHSDAGSMQPPIPAISVRRELKRKSPLLQRLSSAVLHLR